MSTERSWFDIETDPADVYVGLGSNEGDRADALGAALRAFAALDDTTVEAVSPVYEGETHTLPDAGPQPDHLNAVVRLRTRLAPSELLGHLQRIEREAGRRPGPSWGPRPLDLDLLLFGDETVRLRSPYGALTVPHPRLPERLFVLRPLADLAPDLVVPGLEATVAELLARTTDASRLEPTEIRLAPNPS